MKTRIHLGYTYFTLDNKEEAERAIKNGIALKFIKWGYSAKKMNLDFKKSDLGNIKMNLNEGRKHWKSFLQSALLMAGFTFLIGSI